MMTATGAAVLASATTDSQAAQTASAAPVFPPDLNRFKVGSFEVTVIKDGMRSAPTPGETFGTNQPREAVSALLTENFLPSDVFVNSFSPVLVRAGSELVLFDTGMGAFGRQGGMGRLREGLAVAGVSPTDITVVVLTHLHIDHIGGLMEDGHPAFPNARYVIGAQEYDFWVNPAREGSPAEQGHKAVLSHVKPIADKASFIAGGASVVSGITSELAEGHSPGHMIYRLESEGRQLVITGDICNHYVLSLQRPDWEVRFDFDKAQAAITRKRVFDMLAKDRIAFLGYHMPFPATGFVEKKDVGYRFVPKSYQFDI